jgi:hypothetical protein
MKRTPFIAAGIFVTLAQAILPANADTITDNFTFVGTNFYSASGQFTYDSTTDLVSSITGTVTSLGPATAGSDGPITGLIPIGLTQPFVPPTSVNVGFNYDNTFNGTFNGNGILFSFGTGNYGQIYDNNLIDATDGVSFSAFLPDGNVIIGTAPDGTPIFGGPIFDPGDAGTLTVSAAVPEPSTWLMMLFGFCSIGLVTYKRRKIGTASQTRVKQGSSPVASATSRVFAAA